jgi:hypothetical protein
LLVAEGGHRSCCSGKGRGGVGERRPMR